MKLKFFTDRWKGQDLNVQLTFFPEKSAVNISKQADCKRIWIEVEMPDDRQLWPNDFMGEIVPVTNTEVEQ